MKSKLKYTNEEKTKMVAEAFAKPMLEIVSEIDNYIKSETIVVADLADISQTKLKNSIITSLIFNFILEEKLTFDETRNNLQSLLDSVARYYAGVSDPSVYAEPTLPAETKH